MESKFDETKFDRLSDLEEKREIVVVDTSLMENLISYCSSSSFTSAIEDFKRDHAYAFMSLAEEKSDGCHSLELTSIFNKFQTIIENQFQSFAEKEKVSIDQIFEVFTHILLQFVPSPPSYTRSLQLICVLFARIVEILLTINSHLCSKNMSISGSWTFYSAGWTIKIL